jgi:hypothetical protein
MSLQGLATPTALTPILLETNSITSYSIQRAISNFNPPAGYVISKKDEDKSVLRLYGVICVVQQMIMIKKHHPHHFSIVWRMQRVTI